MPSDFHSKSVVYGLHLNEFADLPPRVKKKLLRLMARISEKSYRRGFQHGGLEYRTVDPVKFRFERSLDKSPYTDSKGGHSALERMEIEYNLAQIGLCPP